MHKTRQHIFFEYAKELQIISKNKTVPDNSQAIMPSETRTNSTSVTPSTITLIRQDASCINNSTINTMPNTVINNDIQNTIPDIISSTVPNIIPNVTPNTIQNIILNESSDQKTDELENKMPLIKETVTLLEKQSNLTVEDVELGKMLNQINLECDTSVYTDIISYYDGMGPALYKLCKFESSLNFFDESLAKNPNDVEMLLNKDSALGKIRYFSSAITYGHWH